MNTITIVLLCLVGSLIFHQIVTWIQIRDLKQDIDHNSDQWEQTWVEARRFAVRLYELELKADEAVKRIEEQKAAKDTLRQRCFKLEGTSQQTTIDLDNLRTEWRTARKILESQIEGIRAKADREIGMFTAMIQQAAGRQASIEKKTIDDIMARLGSLETRRDIREIHDPVPANIMALNQRVGVLERQVDAHRVAVNDRFLQMTRRVDRNTDAFATLEKDVRILQDAVRANADRVTQSITLIDKNEFKIKDTQRVVRILDTVISGHIRATDRHVKLPVRKSVKKPVKKTTPVKRKKS